MVFGSAPRKAKRRQTLEAQLVEPNLPDALRQSAHEISHGGYGDDGVQLGVIDDVFQLIRLEQVVQRHDRATQHPCSEHGHGKEPGGWQHDADMGRIRAALNDSGKMKRAGVQLERAASALVINGRDPSRREDQSSND